MDFDYSQKESNKSYRPTIIREINLLPNQALQPDAAGAALTWVRVYPQSAAACGRSAIRRFQLYGTSPAAFDLVTAAAARTLLAALRAGVPFALHAGQRRS
jgi:hypothetical protein